MKIFSVSNLFIYLFAAVLSLSFQAQAEFTNSKCSRVLTHSENIQISRDYDQNDRVCYISLHPMNAMDLKYRDFYFDNRGMFMVFNSYGEGSDATTTASRVFYLHPTTNDYPDFSIEANGDVVVKTVSGHLLTLDAKSFSIKSFSPGSFIEKPLSKNNKGGVEIKPATGYWLDAGFKMGGMANDRPSGNTLINGALGGQCSVKNSELFSYGEDIIPRYKGTALTKFIRKRCPVVKF